MNRPLTHGAMKARLALALLLAAAAAGCTGDEAANPNLAAPKLVLTARADGNITVFIHGAFGDRIYDWISLRADNMTISDRTQAFSLEETVPRPGFYFEAAASTARDAYELRGRVDVDFAKDEARVSFVQPDGDWGNEQGFGLPFERVLVRREAS